MKLAVIIATAGRKEVVAKLLSHLSQQHVPPDEVILSVADAAHLPVGSWPSLRVRSVFGKPGLPAQRNTAIDEALDRFDILTFLDDDFIPANDYLDVVRRAFSNNPSWAVATGHVIRDGVTTGGIDWDEGLRILHADTRDDHRGKVFDRIGGYGCNMSIRTSIVGTLRFDERLVLYGWQEDTDFTSQLRRQGRVVCLGDLRGVHLGVRSGRVSGERFGYSQVVNPIYLVRKGSVPALFAFRLMFRNIVANLVHSVHPESYVDRRGRLRGNILALRHVAAGRIEPEFILKI